MTALLHPLPEPYSLLTFVTPAMAKEWLTYERPNRKLLPSNIDQFAREMRVERWKVNGDSIRFDWNGKLMNGYHRLNACVQADTGFRTFVVYDLEPDSFDVMDTGKMRGIAQILQMAGHKNSTQLAALVKLKARYEAGKAALLAGGKLDKLSAQEVRDIIEDSPDMEDSIAFLYGSCTTLLQFAGSPAVAALVHLYGTRRHGRAFTDDFFRGLDTGTDLPHGSPVHALREKLRSLKQYGSETKQHYVLGTYIPAWNAYVTGKRMVRLNPLDWLNPEIDLTIR